MMSAGIGEWPEKWLEKAAEVEAELGLPQGSAVELGRVAEERIRQNDMWGIQRVSLAEWSLIIGEEYGEAIEIACSTHFEYEELDLEERIQRLSALRTEISHTAAVAIQWMEHLSEAIADLEAPGEDESDE